MQWLKLGLASAVVFIAVILVRLLLIFSSARPPVKKRKTSETCRIAVFLGSGGHTSEMMQLLRALPTERYNHRTYIATKEDKFSMNKALEYELSLSAETTKLTDTATSFDFIQLPRARNVHQRWVSTPLSVLLAFGACCYQFILRPLLLDRKTTFLPDVIIMNGPGTCVPIAAAVYVLRFFGLESPRLIYVESFARVSSLSLTAKILRFFVDRFVVQWQEALVSGTDYRGCLV
ncbi:hypothetical protein CBS101457_006314 [Exobasidium rhododendri]|nr:hypothetical protein CBS101457_006314 [Exobasidium rhododendri]